MKKKLRYIINSYANLQIVMLSLLLGLEVQPGQPAEILLADGLVHSGPSPDPLPVVVGRVGPPVGLHLYVAEDHVLDGSREARNLDKYAIVKISH